MLSGEEKICLPPYYEIANERLRSLLQLLFDKGEEDLLTSLVNIFYPSEDDKKANPSLKPYLYSFCFSSAISKLYTLNKKKSRDNLHDPWVIWENLWLAHWCWGKGGQYFQRQALVYDTIQDCSHSGFLLELHSVYSEMHAIRERTKKPIGSSFFLQERFRDLLQAFMNHVLLFQINLDVEISKTTSPRIHALELELQNYQLRLLVEWSKDGEGFYFKSSEKHETWTCRKCQRVNIIEDRWCRQCGRSWSGWGP